MLALITRPRYEDATHYLFCWAGELIREAEKRKIEVIDLEKEKARRKTVESYLAKKDPDVVILNGHGNEACVMGQDGEVLFLVGQNTQLLKGREVYIRACRAGQRLGPDIIKAGASGFVGYIQNFIFPYNKDSAHRPLEDEYARPNLECSNQVALSLLKGNPAQVAHQDGMQMFRKKLDETMTSNSRNSAVATCLLWNMMNQRALDNSTPKAPPPTA